MADQRHPSNVIVVRSVGVVLVLAGLWMAGLGVRGFVDNSARAERAAALLNQGSLLNPAQKEQLGSDISTSIRGGSPTWEWVGSGISVMSIGFIALFGLKVSDTRKL